MDKINKTFNSGDILYASDLNTIVESVDALVDKTAKLNNEHTELTDVEELWTSDDFNPNIDSHSDPDKVYVKHTSEGIYAKAFFDMEGNNILDTINGGDNEIYNEIEGGRLDKEYTTQKKNDNNNYYFIIPNTTNIIFFSSPEFTSIPSEVSGINGDDVNSYSITGLQLASKCAINEDNIISIPPTKTGNAKYFRIKAVSANQILTVHTYSNGIVKNDENYITNIMSNMESYNFLYKHAQYIGDRKNDMVFACIPDIHGAYDKLEKYQIPFFNKTNAVNNQCRIIISSGDMLFNGQTSKTIQNVIDEFIPKYKAMIKSFANRGLLFIAGVAGHDFNCFDRVGNRDYAISNNLTKQQQRQFFIQPCLDSINTNAILKNRFTYSIPDGNDICYYYIDDLVTGHRHIMLDEVDHPQTTTDGTNLVYNTYTTVLYKQEQLEWLAEALKSTPTGKYVVVHNHVGLNLSTTCDFAGTANAVKEIIKAFIAKGEYAGGSGSETNGYTWELDAIDFSTCGGIFGGLYKGHTHTQEYSSISQGFPQICSINPTSYPYADDESPIDSSTYAFMNNYGGDIYVIKNKEIRNLHYGRIVEKVSSTNSYSYNCYSSRWLDNPITLI